MMASSPETGRNREGLRARAKNLWRRSGSYAVLAVIWSLAIYGLTLLVGCDGSSTADDSVVSRLLCPTNATALGTVAQVVPAIVVAVFVFALGAVFVIAQIIIPSRGSRAIGVLFSYVRVQAVVVGGLVLLVGALLIAVGSTSPSGTEPGAGSRAEPALRFELAAALLAATGGYIVGATVLIVWTFRDQISPRAFKDRLRKPHRVVPVRWLRRRHWTSEELYTSLRVFRGWLRTVNRVGESRDLQFGVEGVLSLIQDYANEVRGDPGEVHTDNEGRKHPLQHVEPRDYEEAKRSPVTRPTLAGCGSEQAWPPIAGSSSTDQDVRWFADEVGRALTRSVESGVRGNTLRRDLDRLLNLFDLGIREFAPCTCDTRIILSGETRTLIRYLTEVGLGVRQCEDWQRGWFLTPALRLARIERYLEHVASSSTNRAAPATDLARTALVGWLLAGDAFISVYSSPGTTDAKDPFLDRSIPLLGTNRKAWDETLAPREWETLEPEWDVPLEPREARQERLQQLLKEARRRRLAPTCPKGRWWR
jgi:hypothetical protein